MRERDYYPAGAYNDPNAPYNECEAPEIELDVTVHEALVKSSAIITNDAWYVTEYEEGGSCTWLEDTNLDVKKDYEEQNERLTVTLAKACKEITRLREEKEAYLLKLEEEFGVKRHRTLPMQDATQRKLLVDTWQRIDYLKALEESLTGWDCEEFEVELDK